MRLFAEEFMQGKKFQIISPAILHRMMWDFSVVYGIANKRLELPTAKNWAKINSS
jgi:hypothetical protein